MRSAAATASPIGSVPRSSAVETCLSQLERLHRHICPRQVLGVRIGLHAGELLEVDLPRDDKRLLVFVETDGCFADAVSVATGCWLGHRTLRLLDHGKSAATVVDTLTGAALRVWAHPAARVRALERAPDASDRWHAQLVGYRDMPSDVLLVAAPVTLMLDVDAIRSRPGRRVTCAACGEDVVNEREVRRDGLVLCRACGGSPYYRVREA